MYLPGVYTTINQYTIPAISQHHNKEQTPRYTRACFCCITNPACMKQKIVIKVQLDCDKCRSKALQIAARASGVNSVSIEGADKDQVAVIGEMVDSVCLAKALRKKFHHANILSVEKVKEKEKEKETNIAVAIPWNIHYPPCPPNVACYEDQYGSFCIIM